MCLMLSGVRSRLIESFIARLCLENFNKLLKQCFKRRVRAVVQSLAILQQPWKVYRSAIPRKRRNSAIVKACGTTRWVSGLIWWKKTIYIRIMSCWFGYQEVLEKKEMSRFDTVLSTLPKQMQKGAKHDVPFTPFQFEISKYILNYFLPKI